MSLTEKTLELNITHELLVLGQGVATVFWSGASGWTSTPPRPGPPIYAAGLTLRQEAKHGWDVSIEIPSVGSTAPRIVFIQFKLGEFRTRSTYPGSAFRTGPLRDHVLFGINNNSYANQHGRLRATAAGLGVSAAAIYALPLITTEALAKANAGRLLAQTAFIRVQDIDHVAVPPIVRGTARKIAISVHNRALREVRSRPSRIDAEDVGPKLVGQIAAVRLHREMAAWRDAIMDARAMETGGRPAGRRLAFRLARYFAYFCGSPEGMATEIFGLRDARKPPTEPPTGEEEGEVLATVADRVASPERTAPGEGALGPAGLEGIERYAGPLVRALASGDWLNGISEPEGLDLLIPVAEPVTLRLDFDDGDVEPSRLAYLVI